jgi:uncharacterized membrane protein
MREILHRLKTKSALVKILGLIIALAGGGVYMLGDSMQDDIDAGLMVLDKVELGKAKLK